MRNTPNSNVILIHPYLYTHTHTDIHTPMNTHSPLHTEKHTYIHRRTDTQTQTHTHIHTHTHTHKHRHTHIYSSALFLCSNIKLRGRRSTVIENELWCQVPLYLTRCHVIKLTDLKQWVSDFLYKRRWWSFILKEKSPGKNWRMQSALFFNEDSEFCT